MLLGKKINLFSKEKTHSMSYTLMMHCGIKSQVFESHFGSSQVLRSFSYTVKLFYVEDLRGDTGDYLNLTYPVGLPTV